MQLSGGDGLRKTCILMQAHLTHDSLANAAFAKRPCIDFKKFIEKALSQRDATYHREATLVAKDFTSSMECGQDIYACIDAEKANRTAEIKKILISIVKTVHFCASNYIPLRGHSTDKGNFVKLLQFCMDAEKETLKKHLAQMAGNAKYVSTTIQNEIFGIASTMVIEEFVAEVNESFISVVADKSYDISDKEQLSIVLRYTRGDKVNESFTGFVEMSSVFAESISAAILAHLSRIGVDLRKPVEQGYDGRSCEWSSKTDS